MAGWVDSCGPTPLGRPTLGSTPCYDHKKYVHSDHETLRYKSMAQGRGFGFVYSIILYSDVMRCLVAYISPLLCFSHAHLRSNVGIIPGISDASASHSAFPSDSNVADLTTTVAKAQREQTTAAQRQGANAKQSDAKFGLILR